MIIKFQQYNESVRDLMKGKSDEEISKEIGDLNPNDLLKKSLDNNYLNGIKLALEKGADPSYNNNYAIKNASIYGHIDIVKILLQDSRVDPSADNNYAIRYASKYEYIDIVKILLQDSRVDPSDNHNYAIRYASDNGYFEIVKLLLQDKRVDPSDDDNFAIKSASYNEHLEVVKLLLKDERVREKLTDEEIDFYKNKRNKLNESIRDLMKPKSDEEIISSLKKLPQKENNNNLLNVSSRGNNSKLIELLIKSGVNVNIKCKDGLTPLMYAVIGNNIENVKMLLKCGADVNIKNNHGHTPLIYAAYYNNIEIAEILIKNGTNINDKSEDDRTALSSAIGRGYIELTDLLKRYGATELNESVRDLMKPKSNEDIYDVVKNKDYPSELFKELLLKALKEYDVTYLKQLSPAVYQFKFNTNDINCVVTVIDKKITINIKQNGKQHIYSLSNIESFNIIIDRYSGKEN